MSHRLPEYCPNGIVRYMSVAIRGAKRAQDFFEEEEYFSTVFRIDWAAISDKSTIPTRLLMSFVGIVDFLYITKLNKKKR